MSYFSSFNPCIISVVFPTEKRKFTSQSSCSFKKPPTSCGTNTLPSVKIYARSITPPVSLVNALVFFTPLSRIFKASSTYSRNTFPYFVSTTLRPLFSNRFVSSSCSSILMAWLRLGCVMDSISAVLV